MTPQTTTHPTHDQAATESRQVGRFAGLAGLASLAAMAAALVLVPADPGGTAAGDIARRYADGSDGYLRATVLESLSTLLLLVLVAGLCDHVRRLPGGQLAATVVALGGGVLAGCQLLGYGLIATLALRTAGSGDDAVVIAVYDASAVAFVASYVGLALACLGTSAALLRSANGRRVAGLISVLVGTAAVLGSSTYAAAGFLSPHGDLGFLVLLLQLLWVATVSVSLLRRP